jgi:hypothetical protein
MFMREHTEFLDLDKNPRYKLIKNDNNSWLENVKRFSHNFSTLLFQLPFFMWKENGIFLALKNIWNWRKHDIY